jgi:LPXTG-motif cell wall-anchored protein
MRSRPRTYSARFAVGVTAALALVAVSLLGAAPANAAAGDFTQYTANGAWVRNVGLGPDGNPWFTDNAAGSKIGFVDVSSGATTTYPVTGYFLLTGITEGPDGNMWFLAAGNVAPSNGTFLVQFNVTTQAFTQYEVPTGNSVENVVSAAGKLWVTEGVGNAIASFDLSTSTWHEYATPGADPTGLALAPNGILWFTMYNGHSVGSLDPSAADPASTVALAAGQPVNGGAQSVTVTADGRVWVGEINNNRIDSYDPATSTWTTGQDLGGTVNLDLFDVTTGSDGNVWYSLYSYDGVGKIDIATGVPTNYRIPPGATQLSSGIVSASDGNIWVGGYLGETMWRFEIPHPATITTSTLAGGKVNVAYTQTLAATGTGPISFAVTAGALPAGLTLDPATGVISGTPTAAGSVSFTITATGTDGATDTAFTIVIDPTLAATGVDPTSGFTLGGLLLIAGAGVLLIRRRRRVLAQG